MKDFWSVATELHQSGTPFVVVTLVQARGHTPQDPGAKAIVTAQGLQWGTVGGGKVEARAISHAQERLQKKEPELVTWNLQKDIGMTCGGEVSYLFETHSRTHWQIAVFGAGHVAQALVRLLSTMDCSVTCIDARPEWIERLPESLNLKSVSATDPSALVKDLKHHYFIVMTQGHSTDVPILEAIFRHHPEASYIGVIGSDLKGATIRKDLKVRGISDADLKKLRCPMGLSLGKNHPVEISVSIVAELLQVRDQLA